MASQRSLSGRLLLWANVLAANVAALAVLVGFGFPRALGFAHPDGWSGFERVLHVPLDTDTAWIVFAAALALLIANLLQLLRRGRPEEPLRHVLSEAPGGTVRVSRDALEAGLRTAGEEVPGISRVRLLVDPGNGKRVRVKAWYQCPEGVSNLDASRRLRAALDERFRSMVHLPDGARVDYEIEFHGFAGKAGKVPEEPPPEPEPEPEPSPFTGPRYPIDDEEEKA